MSFHKSFWYADLVEYSLLSMKKMVVEIVIYYLSEFLINILINAQ